MSVAKQKIEDGINSYIEGKSTKKRIFRNIGKKLLTFVEENNIEIEKGKYRFYYKNWKALNKEKYIQEKRTKVFRLVEYLMSNHFIHTKSDPFPNNLKRRSINRLPNYFLKIDMQLVDSTMSFRQKIIIRLEAGLSDDYEYYLYLYAHLFIIKPISYFQMSTMNQDNYFRMDKINYFVLPCFENNGDEQGSDVVNFNAFFSEKLQLYIDSFKGSGLFAHNRIFAKEKKDYMDFINKAIRRHDNSLNITKIKNIIHYDRQLKTSAFNVTIDAAKIYPRQTLIELSCIHKKEFYKCRIAYKFLEQERSLNSKNNISLEKKDDEFENLESQLYEDDAVLNLILRLKKIKTNPKFKFKKEVKTISRYLSKASKDSDYEIEQKIADYLVFELKKVENNKLSPQSFKTKLQILYTYLFAALLYNKEIDNDIFIKINENIVSSSRLKNTVKAKYIQILDSFFMFSYASSLDVVIEKSYAHRSLVFDRELDILVDTLVRRDKVYYKVANRTEQGNYKQYAKVVFLILLRYSGLRKNELRTRFFSDWYKTEDGYAIDVNREGYNKLLELRKKEKNKSLKTNVARRRVMFTINNENHANIVDKFYKACEKIDNKFIFLEINKKNEIKPMPVSESLINGLNKDMQDILNREVVLHSFRHSKVTYDVATILGREKGNLQNEIFELCNMLGISDPSIMIINYLHIDHIKYIGNDVKKEM
jgi:hypothetical protein